MGHMYHSRPYWYNQMIGVIRLYQDGGSIKAEFWGQPHRGFKRDFRHRIYEHKRRVFEYHAEPQPRSSQEIYDALLEQLSELTRRGGALAGRHVDLNSFRRVGPYVDWIKVLGWKSPTSVDA